MAAHHGVGRALLSACASGRFTDLLPSRETAAPVPTPAARNQVPHHQLAVVLGQPDETCAEPVPHAPRTRAQQEPHGVVLIQAHRDEVVARAQRPQVVDRWRRASFGYFSTIAWAPRTSEPSKII